MYNIIAFVIIIISLGGILYILIRKFPSLIILQTKDSPEEKTQQTKEKIVKARLERHHKKIQEKLSPVGGVLKNYFSVKFGSVSRKLQDMEEKYDKKKKAKPLVTKKDYEKQEKKVEQVLDAAEKEESDNDFEGAEKKYIEALTLDPKNIEVYEKLGDLYVEYEKYDEARQTYQHILKLEESNHKAYEQLGVIETREDDYDAAIENFNKAVEIEPRAEYFNEIAEVFVKSNDYEQALQASVQAVEKEPNNPKYLDFQVEVCFSQKKRNAEDALNRLKEVNPENTKIERYEHAISEM